MASQRFNSKRNEVFGRLLSGAINSIATYEGKTAPIIEEELGELAIVSGKTVQRYKSGHLPPEMRTIEILAEAGVRRGYLGREWLQRFLHAARYPFAEKLLDRLCPLGPARPRPPRIYENLPAPTYSQFVMRAEAFAEVLDGLQQRSAVVLIVGLGGNGKTSLAREVAARCLRVYGDGPHFDAAVWVSDKDRPGTTNLSVVLDEIARTLDYPGFTQFEHDEKRREVEQLLRRQRVLLVVDNFETITDGALLTWLLRLPEPSKALITSREKHRGLWSSWLAELRGMSEAEAQTLINQRLRTLQLDKLVKDSAEFEPLIAVTGGNPKAVEIALGLVKHERRPLQQVVDDIHAARSTLFDDLFARAWALLDEAARRVLIVMTFFPSSASCEALTATADVQGFAFDRTIERLSDLALLDVQQEDLASQPRYTLHPLVRAFASAKVLENKELELVARQRWAGWYIQLVSHVGDCFSAVERLVELDSEKDTIPAVLQWCFVKHRYEETIELVKGVGYYYYVRGLWKKWPPIHLIAADAAQSLNSSIEEAWQLILHVRALGLQGNIGEAQQFLNRLTDIRESIEFPIELFCEHQHGLALLWMAQNDLDAAEQAWQKSIAACSKSEYPGIYEAHRHWLARCLQLKGQLVEAKKLFQEVLVDAVKYNYQRSMAFIQLNLAEIELDQHDFLSAEAFLKEGFQRAQLIQDRRYLAHIQALYARLHLLRGDLPAAHTSLSEAIDLFERLGMRRELAEARQELARLDAGEVCIATPAESSADTDELSRPSSTTLVEE